MSTDTDDVMRKLIAILTLKGNYWGFLFSKIKRRSDENMQYAMGVASDPDDTIVLYYNPKFISEDYLGDLRLVLEHEGMHLLNGHLQRLYRLIELEYDKKKRNKVMGVFNYASDCAVNSLLDLPKVLNLNGHRYELVFPSQYKLPDKKSVEFYYYALLKQLKDNPQDSKSGGGGEGSGGSGQMIGEHSKWIDSKIPDQETFSRKVETLLQDLCKEALAEAKSRGTVPSHISQMVENLLQGPRLPYYQIIRKLVRSSRIGKYRSCSTRINRKRTYVFMIDKKNVPQISPFPGRIRDYTFKIGILSDTSGSMRLEQVYESLSGVKNIIENDRNCETIVIEVDAAIQKEYKVKRISDIDYKIKGRGGTALLPALKRFKELKVDVVLGFTDGYCENLNQVDRKLLPKRIVWIILNGSGSTLDKTGYVINVRG